MAIKDKLKEWDLLKTRNDYEFFHRITKMMAADAYFAMLLKYK